MDNKDKGLLPKYYIQKIAGVEEDFFGNPKYKTEEVATGSEFFVLRLDDLQKDKVHKEACTKAVLLYAELIKDHLPQLSKDLIEKYGQ